MRAGTEAARGYAEILEDVNGFALGGGWHGIALGPYTRADAETALLPYHRDGLIPRVAVIAESSNLRQQFWPVGANILDLEVAPAPIEAETQIVDAGETPAEAQRSKGALSREEKKKLQRLLQWAGFYNAAIDGSFGRGTRNSMAAWQEANSYDTAGILTTTQRAEILKKYNSIFDGLGLEVVRDDAAVIEIKLPTLEVAFEKYESPFAQYKSVDDTGARVLLVSQPGDQNTLYSLYDTMQTLEAVPLDGPRERKNNSFVLIGENATMVSETPISLANG